MAAYMKTLQHLLDLYASFTRRQPQMRCDNTPRLTAAIDARIQRATQLAARERQVERADCMLRKAR